MNRETPLTTSEDYKVRFRLTDAQKKRPVVLKDVGVLVFLSPGIWQQRQIARSLGDGLYEITIKFPKRACIFCSSKARGNTFATATSRI